MQKSSFLNISLALEFELTLKYWLWRFTPGWSTELILKLHIMLWVLEANLINMWIYSILTSIWRVGSWAVEEAWWATQVAHGRTAIAIHTGGHVAVATLLRCGARHITMRRHAACVSIKAWGKENERDSQIIFTEYNFSHFHSSGFIRSALMLLCVYIVCLHYVAKIMCTPDHHTIV